MKLKFLDEYDDVVGKMKFSEVSRTSSCAFRTMSHELCICAPNSHILVITTFHSGPLKASACCCHQNSSFKLTFIYENEKTLFATKLYNLDKIFTMHDSFTVTE